MLIRMMDIEDLETIVSLEKNLFTSAWSYQDFLYELFENVYSHYFVGEKDGSVVGYVGLWIVYEQAQITTLGVEPQYQRQGIARELMENMIAFAKNKGCQVMSLEVRVSNDPAISLYESLGFEKVAIRKDYYQDNHEDAHLMNLRLEES